MDHFAAFLNQVSKTDLLTPNDEIVLARQIQDWLKIEHVDQPTVQQRRIIRQGRKAYERFFTANVKLVVYIAKKFTHRVGSMTLDDLIQEGCFGLAHGIKKFDPERGYKFSTYGYWWIRQAITRAIENSDRLIRLPVNAQHFMHKIRKYSTEFEIEHRRLPTLAECADYVNISIDYFRSYAMHTQDPISLDAPIQRDSDRSNYLDLIAADIDDDEYTADKDVQVLMDLINEFNPVDQEIMRRGYGLNDKEQQTCRQIAEDINLPVGAVRHRRQQCLVRLRQAAQ